MVGTARKNSIATVIAAGAAIAVLLMPGVARAEAAITSMQKVTRANGILGVQNGCIVTAYKLQFAHTKVQGIDQFSGGIGYSHQDQCLNRSAGGGFIVFPQVSGSNSNHQGFSIHATGFDLGTRTPVVLDAVWNAAGTPDNRPQVERWEPIENCSQLTVFKQKWSTDTTLTGSLSFNGVVVAQALTPVMGQMTDTMQHDTFHCKDIDFPEEF